MLQKKLPSLDSFLIALSGGVIVLLLMPACVPRQVVNVHGEKGSVRQFAMSIDDPKLKQLHKKYSPAKRHLPPADLAIAKWNQTLTQYYADSSPADSQVVQVTFSDRPEPAQAESSDASSSDPSRREYWLNGNAQSSAAIQAAKRRLAVKRSSIAPARVTFGDQLTGRRGLYHAIFAVAAGLLLAIGFYFWKVFAPAIQFSIAGENSVSLNMSVRHCDDVPPQPYNRDRDMVLDCDLVGIKQPFAVWIRTACYAGLVVAAIALTVVKGFAVAA